MTDKAYQRAQLAAEAADKKQAIELTLLDVREHTSVCDCFLICHGRSLTHVESIAEGIEEKLDEQDITPLRRSRPRDAKWIVLDYADFVVHVFSVDARGHYDLEGLWSQAEKLDLSHLLDEPPVDDEESDE